MCLGLLFVKLEVMWCRPLHVGLYSDCFVHAIGLLGLGPIDHGCYAWISFSHKICCMSLKWHLMYGPVQITN